MTMLQIQQLTASDRISIDEQKQIHGSGAGPHNNPSSSSSSKYIPLKSSTELWSGYSDGTYDLGTGVTGNVHFIKDNGKLAGAINGDGEPQRIVRSDYDEGGY